MKNLIVNGNLNLWFVKFGATINIFFFFLFFAYLLHEQQYKFHFYDCIINFLLILKEIIDNLESDTDKKNINKSRVYDDKHAIREYSCVVLCSHI